MSRSRPKPDALLAQAEAEESSQQKGKLKVFFGAAPGVGKTFTMLSEAAEKRANGLDVVVGYVETHHRVDIEQMLQGHEILPRLKVEYRGTKLEEFDLESAIKRAPALILVDEMAHTNIAGVVHTKRWQDIVELLNRGIDVYTTLNVQHIESLNDIIKQITGVTIHETVPDSVLELAHSIELVDLPPDDLLKRLEEGKVYFPTQAELAIQHFFRKANLTALRELALRFTAERVNLQVQSERRDTAGQKVWPTSERILVCVDHKPFSIKLIRTARRMAQSLHAEWLAIFVDSSQIRLIEDERQNAIENLRLAEQLGAETAILTGYDMVQEVIDYAHNRNITKIIVGKEIKPRWTLLFTRSFSDELVRVSKEIDVYIITRQKGEFKPVTVHRTRHVPVKWIDYFFSLATVAICTAINFLLDPFLSQIEITLIYLLGIIFIALRGRVLPTLLAIIISTTIYINLFIPNATGTEIIYTHYFLMLFIILLIAEITLRIASVARQQTSTLHLQENRTANLYHLNRELASHRGMDNLLRIAMQHIADIFDCTVCTLLPTASGHLAAYDIHGKIVELDVKERSIAQWSHDLGQMAGLGTTTLPFSSALFYPMQGSSGKIAVLRIQPNNPDNFVVPEQLHLLETFIRQITLAIEVDKLQEEVRKSQIEIEIKTLRGILLNSISRELQTPLGEIQHILQQTIAELARIHADEAKATVTDHLNRLRWLIDRFVHTMQIEAGIVELKREPHSIEKIIKSIINKLKDQYPTRTIRFNVPTDLPKILCDKALLSMTFGNLLDNEIKYAPPESPIEITLERKNTNIEISINDYGAGIAKNDLERIFDKFYRGEKPPTAMGSGLGLYICRSIIELHGGKIWAEPDKENRTVFKITLPI